MTYLRQQTVDFNNQYTDHNNRLRTQVATVVFENRLTYGEDTASFTSVLTNSGTSTYLPYSCAMELAVTTADASKVVRTSNRYFSQPTGRELTVTGTVRMGPQKTNVVSRFGLFDDGDGVYLERASDGLAVCLVKTESGGASTTRVLRAQWNVDPLDGTGPSKLTVDESALHSIVIMIDSVGVGYVSIGFMMQSVLVIVHRFSSNTATSPILRPISLPIRAEIVNTGTTASASDMVVGACSLFVDGPYLPGVTDARPYVTTTGTSAISISNTVWTPVATIRLAELRNGIKYRGYYMLQNTDILINGSGSIKWEGVLNATLTGTPDFQPVASAPGSAVELDMSATGYSGGYRILSGHGTGGSGGSAKTGGTDIAGTGRPVLYGKTVGANDTLTLGVIGLTAGMSVFVIQNHLETID